MVKNPPCNAGDSSSIIGLGWGTKIPHAEEQLSPSNERSPVLQLRLSSVTQLCPTLRDLRDCSTPGFPVYHQLLELAQTHVHQVGDAIQPSYFTAAAAAAKSLQSCLTLCDPTDGSPLGSPVPGILQARTLEWVAISFSNA